MAGIPEIVVLLERNQTEIRELFTAFGAKLTVLNDRIAVLEKATATLGTAKRAPRATAAKGTAAPDTTTGGAKFPISALNWFKLQISADADFRKKYLSEAEFAKLCETVPTVMNKRGTGDDGQRQRYKACGDYLWKKVYGDEKKKALKVAFGEAKKEHAAAQALPPLTLDTGEDGAVAS